MFIKSELRFRITIISANALYTDLNPRGFPVHLRRDWNRADQLLLKLNPEDINRNTLDLDVVQRGDFVQLEIENQPSFYGEIYDKKQIRSGTSNNLEIKAHGQHRILDDIQINRDIFNGYYDNVRWQVDDSLLSNLKEGIKPVISADIWLPQGTLDARLGRHSFTENEIRLEWNTANNERRVASVFKPQSITIERLYVMLADLSTINSSILRDNVELSFQTVVEVDGASFPEDLVPSGVKLKKRDGNDAVYNIMGNSVQENWENVTAPASDISSATLQSESDLAWTIIGGAGSSQIDTVSGGLGFFGFNQFIRLNYDGTNQVGIETDFPDSATNVSPQGWVTVQVKLSDIDVEGEINILVNGPGGDQVAARIRIENNNFILEYGVDSDGNDEIQFETGFGIDTGSPPDEYIYWFYFRLRPTRLEFDFWYIEGNVGFDNPPVNSLNEVGVNLNFINRSSFTTTPTKITKYQIIAEDKGQSNSGFLDVGFVNGSELGNATFRQPAWALFDFSNDPLDVEPGNWICWELRLGIGSPRADTNAYVVGTLHDNASVSAQEIRSLDSANADSGTPTWTKIAFSLNPPNGFIIPFILEYSDSWKPVVEGRDFLVDYDAKQVDWKGGTNRIGVLKTSRFIPVAAGVAIENGFAGLETVRISEYSNPSSGGIIQSNNRMRLPDIVKYITGFTSLFSSTIVDGNNDGSDDAVGVGFNTSSFEIPVYIARQSSLLQIMRDLAEEYNAVFQVGVGATPNFIFEAAKVITDIDINNLNSHEFFLTNSPDFGEVDNRRIRKMKIGISENDVYTTFPMVGQDLSVKVVKVNWDLVDTLGREIIRHPETFSKEIEVEKLWRFGEALAEVFAIQVIEGEIEVLGYWPPAPAPNIGRLDINGIIRIVDSRIPNGLDLTGTNNVFKIESIKYIGKKNRTKIFVSNRNLHRLTEERLDELRQLLNGIEPNRPQDPEPHKRIDKDTVRLSSSGLGDVYMALYSGGLELNTVGYRRILTDQRTHPDGYISFTAYWPEGVGSIDNDRNGIDSVRLFDALTGGTELADANFSDSRDIIYKKDKSRMHIVIFVADEDVFGSL